jgi:hypothetical protein
MNSSFRIRIAHKRLPRTRAPRWFSAYENRPRAAMIMPTKLSTMMSVKNLRYTLNHSMNRTRRLTFRGAFGAGFLTVASSSVASVAFDPFGNCNDSSGTLAAGVVP